nr:hypothetical protein CFP56_13075 [Quercus suber]
MTIEASHVLRIKRTDTTGGGNVLLHITPARAGSLDLKLIATEQEHLYHCTIRESSLKSLQAERYEGSLQDFKDVLRAILLQEASVKVNQKPRDIEVTSVIDDDTLTVYLRRNTSGIKSAIGSIVCVQDDEREAVSFPEWVDTAIAASENAQAICQELQTSLSSAEEQISALKAQLDDLISAKKAHEDDLLQKFAQILNAKKFKIRDQQRQLGDMNVGSKDRQAPSRNINYHAHRSGTNKKSEKIYISATQPSRACKRKAIDDQADEVMIDEAHETSTEDDEAIDDEQESTPPRDDGGESVDEAFEVAHPLSQPESRKLGSAEKHGSNGLTIEPISTVSEELPERRTLPFGRKAKDEAPADLDDSNSTDDDEI